MKRSDLRQMMSFGFEATFTIPEWWTDQGFVATSDTPLKREKIRQFADRIAEVLGGSVRESFDTFHHLQYETFDAAGKPSFVVTLDPGSVEVKTPPYLVDQIEDSLRPLFEAAAKAGMVPYRQWWYGIKKGTEGQCHINLAGLTPETTPFALRPDLLVKYLVYFHNHPCLHYPFMGVDVGPGGNSMRMDEHGLDPYPDHAKGAGADSLERLEELRSRLLDPAFKLTPEGLVAQFKGTKLGEEKYSAPSLLKYKAPLYMIEERGVESLREPIDFVLLCELRMRIFEKLFDEPAPEIKRFDIDDLHGPGLSSWRLWHEFGEVSREIGFDPAPYRVFFERQFPVLSMAKGGEPADCAPKSFRLREARRPRKFLGVTKRGELVIAKTIDTRHGRLELEYDGEGTCKFIADGTPLVTRRFDGQGEGGKPRWGAQLDTFADPRGRTVELACVVDDEIRERARFSLSDMMFVARPTAS
jgi:hypothetical protein